MTDVQDRCTLGTSCLAPVYCRMGGSTSCLHYHSRVQCWGLLSIMTNQTSLHLHRDRVKVGVWGSSDVWEVGVGKGQDERILFRCRQSVAGLQPCLSESDLTSPHCPGRRPRFGCVGGRGWEVGWGWDGVGRAIRRRWSVAGRPRSTETRTFYLPDRDDQSVWVVPGEGCSCYPLASL